MDLFSTLFIDYKREVSLEVYKVYVVDDDTIILNEIVETVPWMDNGFEVIGYCSNPLTAIEDILNIRPDVVLSDLKMPAMDGIEMVRTLKKRGMTCEFVILSAYGTFEDSRSFFLMDGFDYILKPLQQEELQIVLERLLVRLTKKETKFILPERESINPSFISLTEYIKDNFSKKHTLESLSKRFNLNPNYICNLFSKHYNTTLTRFITELRMNESIRLMSQTNEAFKEIAIDCGYSDYYYFCKVFKEFYGVSPSQYRKNNLQ